AAAVAAAQPAGTAARGIAAAPQALRGLITGDSGGEGNEGDQQRARLSGGGMLGGGSRGPGSQGLGCSG
ncbi:hypothetical protein ACV357_34910, partial [Pseudomonas aeruginosa]